MKFVRRLSLFFIASFILFSGVYVSCSGEKKHSIRVYFGVSGSEDEVTYTGTDKKLNGSYVIYGVRESDTLLDALESVSRSTTLEPGSWDDEGWEGAKWTRDAATGDYGFIVSMNDGTEVVYSFPWNESDISFVKNNINNHQTISLDDKLGDTVSIYPSYVVTSRSTLTVRHKVNGGDYAETHYNLLAGSVLPVNLMTYARSGGAAWNASPEVTEYLSKERKVFVSDYGYVGDVNDGSPDPQKINWFYSFCAKPSYGETPKYYLLEEIAPGNFVHKMDSAGNDIEWIAGETKIPSGDIYLEPVYEEPNLLLTLYYYNGSAVSDDAILMKTFNVRAGELLYTPAEFKGHGLGSNGWNFKNGSDPSEENYGYVNTGLSKAYDFLSSDFGGLTPVWEYVNVETREHIMSGTPIVTKTAVKPSYTSPDDIHIKVKFKDPNGIGWEYATYSVAPGSGAKFKAPEEIEKFAEIYEKGIEDSVTRGKFISDYGYGYRDSDGYHYFKKTDGKYKFKIEGGGDVDTSMTVTEDYDNCILVPDYTQKGVTLHIFHYVTQSGASGYSEPQLTQMTKTLNKGQSFADKLAGAPSSWGGGWQIDSEVGNFGYVGADGLFYDFLQTDATLGYHFKEAVSSGEFKSSGTDIYSGTFTVDSDDESVEHIYMRAVYTEPYTDVIFKYYVTGESSPRQFKVSVRSGMKLSKVLSDALLENLKNADNKTLKELWPVDVDANYMLSNASGKYETDEILSKELKYGYRDKQRQNARKYFDIDVNEGAAPTFRKNSQSSSVTMTTSEVVKGNELVLWPDYTDAGYAPAPVAFADSRSPYMSKDGDYNPGEVNFVYVPGAGVNEAPMSNQGDWGDVDSIYPFLSDSFNSMMAIPDLYVSETPLTRTFVANMLYGANAADSDVVQRLDGIAKSYKFIGKSISTHSVDDSASGGSDDIAEGLAGFSKHALPWVCNVFDSYAMCNMLTDLYNARYGTALEPVYYKDKTFMEKFIGITEFDDFPSDVYYDDGGYDGFWDSDKAPVYKKDAANGFRLLNRYEWENAVRVITNESLVKFETDAFGNKIPSTDGYSSSATSANGFCDNPFANSSGNSNSYLYGPSPRQRYYQNAKSISGEGLYRYIGDDKPPRTRFDAAVFGYDGYEGDSGVMRPEPVLVVTDTYLLFDHYLKSSRDARNGAGLFNTMFYDVDYLDYSSIYGASYENSPLSFDSEWFTHEFGLCSDVNGIYWYDTTGSPNHGEYENYCVIGCKYTVADKLLSESVDVGCGVRICIPADSLNGSM